MAKVLFDLFNGEIYVINNEDGVILEVRDFDAGDMDLFEGDEDKVEYEEYDKLRSSPFVRRTL